MAHIEIRVGGCNAVDDPKDKRDVELFLAGALRPHDNVRVLARNFSARCEDVLLK